MSPEQAASLMWESARKGVHFPPELAGQLSVETGYRTQQALLARHLAAGERQAGWKIGFTAPAVRAMFKSEEPVFGYLLESPRVDSGHRFTFSALIKPAIESELCFTLGRGLKGPGVTAAQVREAMAAVAPAFEIIEGRGDMAADLGLGVADDVAQKAWVLGPEVRPVPAGLELAAVRAEITRNGETVADALGRDVIDDQYASIAWLANALAAYGAALEPGQRILSGSFSRPLPLGAGERWETRFSDVGTVSAHFD